MDVKKVRDSPKSNIIQVKEKYGQKSEAKLCPYLTAFCLLSLCTLGLNFGFIKYLKIQFRSIVKLVYCISCLVILVILIVPLQTVSYDESWFYFYLIQFLTYLYIFNAAKYTLCDFMMDVQEIDSRIMISSKPRLGIISLIYATIIFVAKMALCIRQCFIIDCYEYIIPLPVYNFPTIGFELVTWVQVVICVHLYHCIKFIRSSKTDLKFALKTYIATADLYDKIKPLYAYLVVAELFHATPKYFTVLWKILQFIRDNVDWMTKMSGFFYLFHTLAQICCPAIMVEIAISQIDGMKRELHDQIMSEKDAEKRADAENLLQFIRRRPILAQLWSIFPIDLRLPMSLLNQITSYFIVLIQFSHLYD